MDSIGFIEIRISGFTGNVELHPENYDIREVISMLENAEDLLYTGDKKDRPTIGYRIEDGSVKHIFSTSLQFVIGFNAVLGQIVENKSIDFLDSKTARAFENIQVAAQKKNYSFCLRTSVSDSNTIVVDAETHYFRTEAQWAEAEFYLYGKLTNAGGKDKANIHVLTEEFGTVKIQIPKTFLEEYDTNLLYKHFGIRAKGYQHVLTGEMDTTSLVFIELIDYQPKYDESYLRELRKKAKRSWQEVKDPESWLRNTRGSYEA
jgi:hypothetical protein